MQSSRGEGRPCAGVCLGIMCRPVGPDVFVVNGQFTLVPRGVGLHEMDTCAFVDRVSTFLGVVRRKIPGGRTRGFSDMDWIEDGNVFSRHCPPGTCSARNVNRATASASLLEIVT